MSCFLNMPTDFWGIVSLTVILWQEHSSSHKQQSYHDRKGWDVKAIYLRHVIPGMISLGIVIRTLHQAKQDHVCPLSFHNCNIHLTLKRFTESCTFNIFRPPAATVWQHRACCILFFPHYKNSFSKCCNWSKCFEEIYITFKIWVQHEKSKTFTTRIWACNIIILFLQWSIFIFILDLINSKFIFSTNSSVLRYLTGLLVTCMPKSIGVEPIGSKATVFDKFRHNLVNWEQYLAHLELSQDHSYEQVAQHHLQTWN